MDRLNTWARSGLEALQGLSLLQVALIAALGLGLGYWAIRIAVRSLRSAMLAVLLLTAALALARLCFPGNLLLDTLAASYRRRVLARITGEGRFQVAATKAI